MALCQPLPCHKSGPERLKLDPCLAVKVNCEGQQIFVTKLPADVPKKLLMSNCTVVDGLQPEKILSGPFFG